MQVSSSARRSQRLTGLTALENRLVDAASRGVALSCDQLPMDRLATADDPEHMVRAELIRELLLGYHGQLDSRGIQLRRARISGILDLRHVRGLYPLTMCDCVIDEPLLLTDARLPWLDLRGTRVAGVLAEGLQVDGNLLLSDGFRATGSTEAGAVRLSGAYICGQLDLSGAELFNDTGPALSAGRLTVNGSLSLRSGFRATGSGEGGVVRLPDAHIHSNLSLSGSELINNSGPALYANRVQVDGSLLLRRGFRATGSTEAGTLRLLDAHVHGILDLSDAELINDSGPALYADRLKVNGSLFLRRFRATGSTDSGAVRLLDAHIRGQVDLTEAAIGNSGAGPVIDLESVTVESSLRLSPTMICPSSTQAIKHCRYERRHISLDNLTYTATGPITWQQWLHLLHLHTVGYAPQPYQQLATAQRAAGHDGPARAVLIAQQHDLRRRGDLGGRTARLGHAGWGALAGYGYRPARLLLALALAVSTAAGIGVVAGHTPIRDGSYAAAHTLRAEQPKTPCSLTEQVGLGIDRGMPLGTTGLRERCDLDTVSRRGQALTIALWIVQAFIWALATLTIAGYTGLIRKLT